MIKIKTREEIQKMRAACRLARKTLDFISGHVQAGISTQNLNDLCHDFITSHKATPAPLNYNQFPKSICTSINNVVCHGIPSEDEILVNGDIINLDITVILDGYHGDTSRTFIIGEVSDEVRNFVSRSEEAMWRGIRAIKPGLNLYEVGHAIEKYISKFGYGIVEAYGGHGIGKEFHEDPQVCHYYSRDENNILLRPGMIFTVEPMINQGGDYRVHTSRSDGWTVTTRDGGLSAQFEHTVLVNSKGVEVLTK